MALAAHGSRCKATPRAKALRTGPNGTHPEVELSDMYGAVVQRCNNIPASVGYPQSKDCDVVQSRGVHFSDAGKQFTGVVAAGAIVPHL